jgi:hypothetical protein
MATHRYRKNAGGFHDQQAKTTIPKKPGSAEVKTQRMVALARARAAKAAKAKGVAATP